MKRVTLKAVCSALIVGALAFGPSYALAKDTLKYVGSSTVGKFMHAAAEVYTDAEFKINTKPESGGGENATAGGKTDLGGVARDVKPEILQKNVKQFLIGRDAIGAWVNSANPISDLSDSQLKDIFSGTVTNWKEVGGSDQPITVYIVNPQSATRKVFSKAIMGDKEYGGKVKTVRPDPKVIDMVAADPGGIGQLSFALGNTHEKSAQVKKLAIGGQEASVNNPTYPVTRPLYLITKGDPSGPAKAFIDWSLSDAGQAIVKKYFVGK